MIIRSIVELDVSISMTETVKDYIEGEINTIEFSNDFNSLTVFYTYRTVTNNIKLKSSFLVLEDSDIDNFNAVVKTFLPEGFYDMSEREQMRLKYLTGFKLKMAETFTVTPNKIKIID